MDTRLHMAITIRSLLTYIHDRQGKVEAEQVRGHKIHEVGAYVVPFIESPGSLKPHCQPAHAAG